MPFVEWCFLEFGGRGCVVSGYYWLGKVGWRRDWKRGDCRVSKGVSCRGGMRGVGRMQEGVDILNIYDFLRAYRIKFSSTYQR